MTPVRLYELNLAVRQWPRHKECGWLVAFAENLEPFYDRDGYFIELSKHESGVRLLHIYELLRKVGMTTP